jgi:hypothetical protein
MLRFEHVSADFAPVPSSPLCSGSVRRHPKGPALRAGGCNSLDQGRHHDRRRVTAPAPIGLACNALQLGLSAAVEGERLGHGIGRRGSVGSPHRLSGARRKRATGLRSAEPGHRHRRGQGGARRLPSQRRRRGPAVGAPRPAEPRVGTAAPRSGRRDTIPGRPSAGTRGSECRAFPSASIVAEPGAMDKAHRGRRHRRQGNRRRGLGSVSYSLAIQLARAGFSGERCDWCRSGDSNPDTLAGTRP